LEKGGSVDLKFAANEADETALEREIEHEGDADESGSEQPHAMAKEWLDELHEVAGGGEKQNRVTEAQGLGGLGVYAGVAGMWGEGALRVPEETADEGEQEHERLACGDRAAEEGEVHEEDPRVVKPGECGHELLCGKCCEQKEDGGD